MTKVEYSKGLEGVIAAETAISEVDGERGKLYYYGYTIEDLVANCSFEEVTYLLLYGDLPNTQELETFTHKIRSARALNPQILEMIREFPKDAHPMELLQSVISYLSGYVEHRIQHSASCNCRTTLHQVAQLGSVVAAYQRFRDGKEYIAPRDDLSYGANFLYMLHGTEPDELEGRMMDNMLTIHAEHGFNASTFTARVVASTLSTCYCSISAAIGALYGSLHGGANEKAMEMVEHIGSKARAREWINRALDDKQKIPGMGHRVYKTKDPRSIVVEEYLRAAVGAQEELYLLQHPQGDRGGLQGEDGREGQADLPERRLLLGGRVQPDGDPQGAVHAGVRRSPRPGLAGPRPRAAARQQALPAGRNLHRRARAQAGSR